MNSSILSYFEDGIFLKKRNIYGGYRHVSLKEGGHFLVKSDMQEDSKTVEKKTEKSPKKTSGRL